MPVIPILPSDSGSAVEYKVALTQAVAATLGDLADLARWRNYYSGDHELLLSDDQKAFLAGVISDDQNGWPIDNKCRKVVDKVRGRLNVTGWRDASGSAKEFAEVEDVRGLSDAPLEAAISWWLANDLDRWEGELYRAALRDEEAYIIVDHDGTRPRFTVAFRWDGQTGIRMRYEDQAKTKPLYAVKYWAAMDPASADTSTPKPVIQPNQFNPYVYSGVGIQRATIYTRASVWKYARLLTREQRALFETAGPEVDGWTPVRDQGDDGWPLNWVDGQGSPLGLAVVPFVSPRGSVVDAIIGLNNALNKTNMDLLSVADQQGFGLIVAKYDTPPANGKDPDPAGDGLGLRPGSALETNADVTKLPADDMSGLLNYARHLTVSIASNSDIPLHEFVPTLSEVPSGTALQMLDSALATQADECAVWFGSGWRQAMDVAQRLAQAFGGMQGEPETLTPVWKPTSYQDPTSAETSKLQMAQRVKTLVEAGVPLEIVLKREGWNAEDLDELTAAKESEQAASTKSLAQALATQQRNFDRNSDSAGNPVAGVNGATQPPAQPVAANG